MRKFKSLDRNLGILVPSEVASVKEELEVGLSIPKLHCLRRHGLLVNLAQQTQVQQAVLLLTQERELPLDFFRLVASLGLLIVCSVPQLFHKPRSLLVALEPHLVEERKKLLVDFVFVQPHPRMSCRVVERAAVVDVLFACRLLDDRLAGDRPAAMSALDQPTSVGQVVRTVGLLPKFDLHPIPSRPINKVLVLARSPLALVHDLANVGPILQDAVELASRKPGTGILVVDALLIQSVTKLIAGQLTVSEHLKHFGYCWAMHGMNLH